jgi:hypothetical protein
MRPTKPHKLILVVFLVLQTGSLAFGQETSYQIVDFVDLPAELNNYPDSACLIKFSEHWTLNQANLSISKKVMEYESPCAIEESFHLKEISYEFCFLDVRQDMSGLQNQLISLVQTGGRVPEMYRPQEQLLSVYFHEEWAFDAVNQEFTKQVKGITPLIWQLRQSTGGEPVNDAETGLPVYYKTRLKRINLRKP